MLYYYDLILLILCEDTKKYGYYIISDWENKFKISC